MQATIKTTRPARRMSAARHAALTAKLEAQHQARELAWQARQDAQAQQQQPTPEFTEAPRLTLLPGGLHWSAQGQVPAVGAVVQVQQVGAVQVKGYCHAAGFLGLVVEPQAPPKPSRRKAQPARSNCVFGSQLTLMSTAA